MASASCCCFGLRGPGGGGGVGPGMGGARMGRGREYGGACSQRGIKWGRDLDGGALKKFVAVQRLRQMSVQSSFTLNVSKSLLVNSCNLQLGKSIGQGWCKK